MVGIETEARTSDTSSLLALGLALGWIAAMTGWPALAADIEMMLMTCLLERSTLPAFTDTCRDCRHHLRCCRWSLREGVLTPTERRAVASFTVLGTHYGGSSAQLPTSHLLGVAANLQHEMQQKCWINIAI